MADQVDIVVVDDSELDRTVVQGLLESQPNYHVRLTASGKEAMLELQRQQPHVLLTDLYMPEMDGLTLVTEVREQFPNVPIILMTSRGSEDTAKQALRHGAANYVPKSMLATELLSTLRAVLSASSETTMLVKFMEECLLTCQYEFRLENDPTLIPALVRYLQQEAARLRLCDTHDRVRMGIALEEALVNALYHGNLGLSSELREDNRDHYYKLAETRRGQQPYAVRRIHVDARLNREEGIFVIRDEGEGFDPAGVADPREESLDKVSGRGLLLMRTFMDDVAYNDVGNQVTLTKRRKSTAA